MFVLNPAPTFMVQVPITVPGKAEPLELAITFKHKNRAALAAWAAAGVGKDDTELLGELIVTWSGMQDDKGEDVLYSFTALNDLIAGYWAARDEIISAYLRELKESKIKNFARLRAV